MVILGDFNTYKDFEGPFQLFTARALDKRNPCLKKIQRMSSSFMKNVGPLTDAWLSIHPDQKGLTFSNMVC